MKIKILPVFGLALCSCAVSAQSNIPQNGSTVPVSGQTVVSGLPGMENVSYNNNQNFNYIITWEPQVPLSSESQVTSYGKTVEEVHRMTQYFDGLGRPLQTVDWQQSTNKKDMVSLNLYDAFGREQYKFLPFEAYPSTSQDVTGDGYFKFNPYKQQKDFSNAQYPGENFYYSHTVYEASPLNRIAKAFAPGNSWAGSEGSTIERAVTVSYQVNAAAENIQIWNISNSALTYSGNNITSNLNIPTSNSVYGDGQLYKTITTDEDGKISIEYKDKEGQVVLKRLQIDNNTITYYSTYYVYDDFGLLRFVISPKAVNNLTIGSTTTIPQTVADELCYHYEYDARHRMIAKKVPGSAWVYMVYDDRDRLVYTQDGNMRPKNQWLTSFYDNLNRQVVTGMLTTASTHQDLITYIASANYNQSTTVAVGPSNLAVTVNANPSITGSSLIVLAATAYDNLYQFNTTAFSNSYSNKLQPLDANANTEDYPANETSNTLNLVTGTRIRVISDPNNLTGNFLNTANFYDEKGRLIQSVSDNISGGRDITSYQYDFKGKIMSSYIDHTNPGATLNTHTNVGTDMLYDHEGRILKIRKRIYENNSLIQSTKLVDNTYDALGELSLKSLGQQKDANGYNTSSTPLETLSYTYNIRGWLKGINKTYAAYNSSSTANWFGMQLSYDWGFNTKYYNGNISGVTWRSKGDGEKRAYGFEYDNANRLLKAEFNQYNGAWNKSAHIDFSVAMGSNGNYNTAYDENGNISKMQEMGVVIQSSGVSSTAIDDLTYSYASASNKLGSVSELAPGFGIGDFNNKNAGTDDYNYDANGNLITDKNKRINAGGIVYNYLNLPSSVTVNDDNNVYKGTISYTYDALGNKLQKTVSEKINATTTNTITTSYIGAFVYESKSSYVTGGTGNIGTPSLQYITTEEGRMRVGKNSSGNDIVNFDYFIKDHLGNVRVVLTDEQKTDFYPVADLENQNSAAINTELQYYDIANDAAHIVDESLISGFNGTTTNEYQNNNTIYNPNSNSTNNSTKLYKLNGKNGSKTGLGITLKVMSGDIIDIYGKSFYHTGGVTPDNTNLITSALNSFLGTIAGSAAVSATHTGISGTMLGNNTGTTSNLTTWLNGSTHTPASGSVPRAFINWVFLDEQFNTITTGGLSGADPVKSNTDVLKSHHKTVSITKNGYLYVYCSNESDIDVFFDNLQVIHSHGPLVEETHYYPFGLTMASISSKALNFGDPTNKKGFNGGNELQSKEFSDGSGLDLYDATHRMYDPQLGRFGQIDPLGEYMRRWSPYTFSFNNPILYNDPLGDSSIAPGFPDSKGGKANQLNEVVVSDAKPKSWVRKAASWIPVLGFGLDSYDAFKGGHWIQGSLLALAAVGDALTLGEEGVIVHAGEEVLEHKIENTAIKAEEEVLERGEQNLEENASSYYADEHGNVLAKDQEKAASDLEKGGYKSEAAVKKEEGKIYKNVTTRSGKKVDVRLMKGNKNNVKRAVINHPGTNTGKTLNGIATDIKNNYHFPQQ